MLATPPLVTFPAGKDDYFNLKVQANTGQQTTRMYLKTDGYLSRQSSAG